MCVMQISRTNGLWYWAEYSTFSISDEVGKYQLTVDGYSGNAGNALRITEYSMWKAHGRMFSTPDSDNDAFSNGNCAENDGWWYGDY